MRRSAGTFNVYGAAINYPAQVKDFSKRIKQVANARAGQFNTEAIVQLYVRGKFNFHTVSRQDSEHMLDGLFFAGDPGLS